MDRSRVYQKKTLLEHVLLRAEVYIGSKEPQTVSVHVPVFDKINGENKGDNVNIILKELTFVPAFLKIFDEIIVNAADNYVKGYGTDCIKVNIDIPEGEISVYNNGKGIPVVMHETENVYVPEMVFGHLLTGSNYDDDEKRVTGGLNGYGAKLVNIYSTEFSIETHDSIEGKTYKQTWKNNMSVCSTPKITSSKNKKDYTKVTFKPDLEKLNMRELDVDSVEILHKRVFDMTGCLSGVKVFLNDNRIKISNFKDYVSCFLREKTVIGGQPNEEDEESELSASTSKPAPIIIHEKCNDRWEIAVSLSDTGTFQQISFVNNISTVKGGTHVDLIVNQIVSNITDAIKKKDKKLVVKPAQIKNQLFVFINCLVENPTFEGQIKETMTLRASKFGSTCNISDAFFKKLAKLEIAEKTTEMLKEKDEKLLKKTDGQKRTRLTGITKLNDANDAGSKKAKNCTLFIVEGESALSFAITGIPVVAKGRDIYGAYPLKGKLLNVRDATTRQKLDNVEINQLKQILGLKEGFTYTNVDSLRYGHVCILVDSDVDGVHIKGLILNWLESSFPSLLKIPGFLLDFKSPIVKCEKGGKSTFIYTLEDYEDFKKKNGGGKGWTIKYFKGLGTSKKEDIKKYFSSIDRHLKRFRELDEIDSEKLDMVFNKKRANDRKTWLQKYDGQHVIPESQGVIKIQDFINMDLIEFSMYDNIRSIPSVVDGLKPGQRKILYTACKTKLVTDLKVAQFAAKVAELTEYRHGEVSLNQTVVKMAQDFPGSNNMNLLSPEGEFGTRRKGGDDAAATRYIYTKLSPVTRDIFPVFDDAILDYLNEDGYPIEPKYYVPVIPMVLVNGTEGIGSGFSTTVLCYNPKEIIDMLLEKTKNPNHEFKKTLKPYYKGFFGDIIPVESTQVNVDDDKNVVNDDTLFIEKNVNDDAMIIDNYDDSEFNNIKKWMFTGKITKTSSITMDVTELPIHVWTETYKEYLEKQIEGGFIKDYKEYHTDSKVHFVLKLSPERMEQISNMDKLDLLKSFKLTVTKTTTNMMLFDQNRSLKHYGDTLDIMNEFYHVRMECYKRRKEYLLKDLQDQLKWARNRQKFIEECVADRLKLRNQTKGNVVDQLSKDRYDKKDSSFDYLLTMPLHTLTNEKVTALKKETETLQTTHDDIQNTSIEQMYQKELRLLESSIKL